MDMRDSSAAGREDEADSRRSGSGPGRFAAGTPEDVAALYTWANIQGARYRDFSGSRVRYREQVRARAAEVLRDRTASGREEELAARARSTDLADWVHGPGADLQQPAVPAGGPADGLRDSVSRAIPVVQVDRAEEEQVSRQARIFREELEMRLRRSARQEAGDSDSWKGADPTDRNPSKESSGATYVAGSGLHDVRRFRESAAVEAAVSGRSAGRGVWDSGSTAVLAAGRTVRSESGYVDVAQQAMSPADEVCDGQRWERVEDELLLPPVDEVQRRSLAPLATGPDEGRVGYGAAGVAGGWGEPRGGYEEEAGTQEDYDCPAWLYGGEGGVQRVGTQRIIRQGTQTEAIVESAAPIAGRWSALRSLTQHGDGTRTSEPVDSGDRRAPLLVVFSLAGGVGKTSLVATLGRVLSASGERVALGDTAACSLLPFYFGARDVRPGATRMFAPPEGSEDKPIFVANYEVASYELSRRLKDMGEQRQLVGDILRNGSGCSRTLLDLGPDAEWLVRRMVTLGSTVLVPLSPDMNSVVGLDTVERYFERMADSEGRPMLPLYLLNRFDEELDLHRDVRDVLRRRLGARLLRCVIRHSPAVCEAVAEGMTVVDYAPESPVARDYADLAAWLRSVSPAAVTGMQTLRSGAR